MRTGLGKWGCPFFLGSGWVLPKPVVEMNLGVDFSSGELFSAG